MIALHKLYFILFKVLTQLFVKVYRAVTRLSWCNSRNVIVSYLDSILCRHIKTLVVYCLGFICITVSSSCLKKVKCHNGIIAQLQLIRDEFSRPICFYS